MYHRFNDPIVFVRQQQEARLPITISDALEAANFTPRAPAGPALQPAWQRGDFVVAVTDDGAWIIDFEETMPDEDAPALYGGLGLDSLRAAIGRLPCY